MAQSDLRPPGSRQGVSRRPRGVALGLDEGWGVGAIPATHLGAERPSVVRPPVNAACAGAQHISGAGPPSSTFPEGWCGSVVGLSLFGRDWAPGLPFLAPRCQRKLVRRTRLVSSPMALRGRATGLLPERVWKASRAAGCVSALRLTPHLGSVLLLHLGYFVLAIHRVQ